MGSLTQLFASSTNKSPGHGGKQDEKYIIAFFIKTLSTLKERQIIVMKGNMCNSNSMNKFSWRRNSFLHSFIHKIFHVC